MTLCNCNNSRGAAGSPTPGWLAESHTLADYIGRDADPVSAAAVAAAAAAAGTAMLSISFPLPPNLPRRDLVRQ